MTLKNAAHHRIETWMGHPIHVRGGIAVSIYNTHDFTVHGMVVAPKRNFKANTLPESNWEWVSEHDVLVAHGLVVCDTRKPYERLGVGTHHGQLGCGVRHSLDAQDFHEPYLKSRGEGYPPVFFTEKLPERG